MAFDFQKLADVEAVEEFPEEGASVLIEHEGSIKKCPADGIGGGGGTYVIELDYDLETGGMTPKEPKTFDEYIDMLKSGTSLCVKLEMDLGADGYQLIIGGLRDVMVYESTDAQSYQLRFFAGDSIIEYDGTTWSVGG